MDSLSPGYTRRRLVISGCAQGRDRSIHKTYWKQSKLVTAGGEYLSVADVRGEFCTDKKDDSSEPTVTSGRNESGSLLMLPSEAGTAG